MTLDIHFCLVVVFVPGFPRGIQLLLLWWYGGSGANAVEQISICA